MKAAVRKALFHVASSKENNWRYLHCPEKKYSWCKFSLDRTNGTSTYKPEQMVQANTSQNQACH